ncbi:MAG: UPF0175 family protein [Candidatus Bathyarchaeia archaeon]
MTETEQTAIVTIRLSKRNLHKIEAVQTLENVDRSTLLKEFIENGLRERITKLYTKGKISAGRAAEILDIPLREFLELLQQKGTPINWDTESIKEYLKQKYGE